MNSSIISLMIFFSSPQLISEGVASTINFDSSVSIILNPIFLNKEKFLIIYHIHLLKILFLQGTTMFVMT